MSIDKKQAYLLKDGEIMIGAFIFKFSSGSIDFLAIHPQYKKKNIAKAFLQKILNEFFNDTISITTFREGDKADIGYRETIKNLGFAECELLVEFGYPTQRFSLQRVIGIAEHE